MGFWGPVVACVLCVKDLLKFYSELLRAAKEQFTSGHISSEDPSLLNPANEQLASGVTSSEDTSLLSPANEQLASAETSVKNSFLLSPANEQSSSGETLTKESPLKQVNYLMSAKIPMGDPTFRKTSYGSGWARVQLPGPMGAVGCKPTLNTPRYACGRKGCSIYISMLPSGLYAWSFGRCEPSPRD